MARHHHCRQISFPTAPETLSAKHPGTSTERFVSMRCRPTPTHSAHLLTFLPKKECRSLRRPLRAQSRVPSHRTRNGERLASAPSSAAPRHLFCTLGTPNEIGLHVLRRESSAPRHPRRTAVSRDTGRRALATATKTSRSRSNPTTLVTQRRGCNSTGLIQCVHRGSSTPRHLMPGVPRPRGESRNGSAPTLSGGMNTPENGSYSSSRHHRSFLSQGCSCDGGVCPQSMSARSSWPSVVASSIAARLTAAPKP